MTYVFLIAAFNALFFAFLLMQKRPVALHDKVLFFWLLYLGLFTGVYALTSHFLFSSYPLLSASFISLLMLHGPFLYLYISSLTFNKTRLRIRDLVHFVPFLLFNIYLFLGVVFPQLSQGIRLDHAHTNINPPLLFSFFLILTALSGPVYFLQSIRLFKKLDINIFNNFSFSETIDLDWLRKLVYIFGIIWTALIIIAVIHHVFHLFSLIFCTDGLSLSLSLFIILIGYFGLQQKEIFINYPGKKELIDSEPTPKYSGSGLKKDDAEKYSRKLQQHMDMHKPYLDAGITLQQLSDDLGISSHYLSQVINENMGQNFFDFINKYRVEEVKSRIGDPGYDKLSLLGIALESGFNSKSAFNRLFKKFTGMTPSQYKEKNQSNNQQKGVPTYKEER